MKRRRPQYHYSCIIIRDSTDLRWLSGNDERRRANIELLSSCSEGERRHFMMMIMIIITIIITTT